MTAETRSSLDISLLGSFRCVVDGSLVQTERWLRPKPKLVVKLLALQPQYRMHREAIVELLWPDLSGHAGAKSLDKAIHVARRAFEPALASGVDSRFIGVEDRHVFLRETAAIWVDASVFERRASQAIRSGDVEACESARALYRGELLADDLFADWARGDRERLRALYADLLSTLAERYREHGRTGRGLELLCELADADPYDESIRRRLMVELTTAGARQRALREFESLADGLRRDLGVEPEPETTALRDRIAAEANDPARSIEASPSVLEPPSGLARPSFGAMGDVPHNLPYPVTSFVGRERDVASVGDAVRSSRLVTLVGPGGIGKTRLASRVGFEQLGNFPDGVWFVELGAIEDASVIATALARTLGIHEEPGRDLISTLAEALRRRRTLVVLDNCEHLVPGCADIASHLLAVCPDVSILATSRERLNVTGERVYPVPLMDSPGADEQVPVARLPEYDAIALLVERIASIVPEFELTSLNAPLVAALCRRLDGVPLAIEFAAARARLLPLQQILARLDDRFRLLVEGNRAASPRHRSLEASMEWSYRLLTPSEQIVLQRLAVCAGGASLEAVEALSSPVLSKADVLGTLGGLVDKSLVVVERREQRFRYRLLETVRAYAIARLEESGDVDAVGAEHRRFFLELAEQVDRERTRSADFGWLEELDLEHGNVHSALRSTLGQPAGAAEGLRFCRSLGRYWIVRGNLSEGLAWTARALEAVGPSDEGVRADVLVLAGYLTMRLLDTERAKSYLEEALALRRATNDRAGEALVLRSLGDVAENQGDSAGAEMLYRGSLAIGQEIGSETVVVGAIYGLGLLAADAGDWAAAEQHYQECLVIYERLGNRLEVATMISNLGETAHRRGDVERAVELLEQSRRLAVEMGYRHLEADTLVCLGSAYESAGEASRADALFKSAIELNVRLVNRPGVASALEGLARLAGSRGDHERVLRLAGAARAIRDATKWALAPSERSPIDSCVATARTSVGEFAGERLLGHGRAMPIDEAIEYALGAIALEA